MSFNIKIDSNYAGTSTIIDVLPLLKGATFYNLATAKMGQIVSARVSGKRDLYRVDGFSPRELRLVSAKPYGLGTFYLGGPMRGYPLFNFPAFLTAAAQLRGLGFKIVDPATHDMEGGFDMTKTVEENSFSVEKALGWDFKQIVECDGIILLDGWEKSTGAKAERLIAEMTGKQVLRINAALELFAEDGWTPSLTFARAADKVSA